MSLTSCRVFLCYAIVAVAMTAAINSAAADSLRQPSRPNLLETIMEPILREMHVSRPVGPLKRPFSDGDRPLLNKKRLQPFLAPVVAHSAPECANRSKNEEQKGSETNGYQPTDEEERGRDPVDYDVMKFWRNFMTELPLDMPDFNLRPSAVSGLPSATRLEERVKSVVSESNSSRHSGETLNATIKPVARRTSAEFEVIVFPPPAANNAQRNDIKTTQAEALASTSKVCNKGGLLVMLLVVACSIFYLLGSALRFFVQKKQVNGPGPTNWAVKEIHRPLGAPVNSFFVPLSC